MAADLDDLRARLEAIAEELGDLALASLRDAVESGATRRPADERRLSRARRSVERAVAALGGTDADDASET